MAGLTLGDTRSVEVPRRDEADPFVPGSRAGTDGEERPAEVVRHHGVDRQVEQVAVDQHQGDALRDQAPQERQVRRPVDRIDQEPADASLQESLDLLGLLLPIVLGDAQEQSQ